MKIFGTDIYRTKLAEGLMNGRQEVSLISAYLTNEGIDWILDKLPNHCNCRVVSRWNCHELLNGASDIEAYEKLRERNYSLYIMPDLHAKVIIVDSETLFLGSANITNSGLRLVPGGNKELGTILMPDEDDLLLIETLFDEATFVTEELYREFYQELQLLKETTKPSPRFNWSKDLRAKLIKPPAKLWVAETLWCASPETLLRNVTASEAVHDLALLGFVSSTTISQDELKKAFSKSRLWRWLINTIEKTEKGEMYFGELSAKLHNSFLDDPAPYRKNVKELLSNLLHWTAVLGDGFIEIERPNHSLRIKINR